MIYLGNGEIQNIYLGNAPIQGIYAGDLLIYPTTVTGWSVNPSSIKAEKTGGTATIRITSLSAWTISSNESWITFSQNSGESGRTSVIASFEENETGEKRYATITATDGVNTSTVSVEQLIKDTRLVLTYNVTSTSFGTKIFSNTSYPNTYLSKIELENGTEISTNISAYTFSYIGLQTIYCTLKNPTGELNGLCQNCDKLVGVEIPYGVSSIGSNLFTNCQFETLVLPDTVSAITCCETIAGCGALKSLTLGSGLTSIANTGVRNNSNMNEIVILAITPPSLLSNNVFSNTNNCPIYVPDESVSLYQNASTNWSRWSNRIIGISNRS